MKQVGNFFQCPEPLKSLIDVFYMMIMQTKTRNVQRRERLDISGFAFIDRLVQADFYLLILYNLAELAQFQIVIHE